MKRDRIKDVDVLAEHPRVKNFLELPCDLVMFEFVNEEHNRFVATVAPAVPSLYDVYGAEAKQIKAIWDEKEALLKPNWLEQQVGLNVNLTTILFSINGATYTYEIPRQQVGICYTSNTTQGNDLHFSVTLTKNTPKNINGLHSVLDKWHEWGASQGFINSMSVIDPTDREVAVNVFFAAQVEHSLACLVFMLLESRGVTKVTHVGFQ